MSSSQKQKNNFHNFAQNAGLFCGISFLLISVPTIADATDPVTQIEEVVVTASKRDQRLKDFSGSVSVVKMDSLKPLATLSDIANQVPGLSVINNGPRVATAITMRGLRMDNMSANDFGGDGATVASYVDNIPLQGFFVPPAFSFKDLQQIEMLRGPQGTLYGNSSIGGLIRYVTAKPDLSKTIVNINASVSQTAASYGSNYDTDLIVNAPLIDNTLGVRLMFGKENNAGFIDNDYLLDGKKRDINSDETSQIRATVLWQPTDLFSLTSSYHYQKINADDRQAANKNFTQDNHTSSSRYLQPMQGELRLSSIDAVYDFDWAKLTASASRYDYTTQSMADQTDFLLTVYGEGYYAEYEDFSAFTRGDVDVIKNSGELRLVSAEDQSLRWILGAFLSTDDLDVSIVDYVPGFAAVFAEERPNDLDFIRTQAETLHEQSAYGELAYDIKPEWEVVLGARYSKYKDDLNVCSLLFPTSTEYVGSNYPLECLPSDDTQTKSLGKFSTKYKFSENQNIYFIAAEGFRRGGANFLPVEIDHNRSYKPDTVVNYEVGTHSDFLNSTLQLNGAVFYMDWKKIQVSTTIEEGDSVTANAGTARSKGFELGALAQLNQAWDLRIGYSYTDAALTETVMSINGGDENAYAGDRLPGAPQDEWNLGLDYQQAIDTATLTAGIDYYYASKITTALNKDYADYANLSGYSMVNAQANVIWRNWRAGVFVNNMGNTLAITGRRTTTNFGAQGQFDYVTRPRTVGLNVGYKF
ncbi:MAG: TonB-dependent receptor [Pseudomonadota bacterium]